MIEPKRVDNLEPGDRFSLSIENELHIPVVVEDCYVPVGEEESVRLVLTVPRFWNRGEIPVRLAAVSRETPMSYSVDIYDLDGGEVLSVNHTSNTSKMWRAAGCDLRDYDKKPAAELARDLEPAIQDMVENQQTYSQWEAPNGWGDYYSTLDFLRKILSAAQQYPEGRVHVSS
jgi:hypothetical protein